jgi:transposase
MTSSAIMKPKTTVRLHHNVLATALANKLARIAWTVLAQGRSYEARVEPKVA